MGASSDNQSWLGYLSYGDNGWLDELLAGLLITIELAISSLAVGLLGGLGLAMLVMSKSALVSRTAQGLMILVRGVPEFLVIIVVFFSAPQLLSGFVNLLGVGVQVEIPKFMAAVIALALIFSVYAAEVFRGAWQSISRGQIEAATAIGMSQKDVLFRIRLPQMWRFAIPGLGNLWMVLIKDTSLAAVIALDELLRVTKVASESSREPLIFYLVAGAMYLALTGLSDLGRIRLEKHARRGFTASAHN